MVFSGADHGPQSLEQIEQRRLAPVLALDRAGHIDHLPGGQGELGILSSAISPRQNSCSSIAAQFRASHGEHLVQSLRARQITVPAIVPVLEGVA